MGRQMRGADGGRERSEETRERSLEDSFHRDISSPTNRHSFSRPLVRKKDKSGQAQATVDVCVPCSTSQCTICNMMRVLCKSH